MIHTKLMPHQIVICDFIRDKPYFGIFADYGTGKTLCALQHIETKKFKRVLVVSTKTSIQSTWVNEVKTHTDFKHVLLVGSKTQKLKELAFGLKMSKINADYYYSDHEYTTLFLINFDGVENLFSALQQTKFDCVIIDESTKIKSPKAQRTIVLWKLGQYIKNRGIMTGFPVTENLSELYSQIKFLDQGKSLGNSFYEFLAKHFVKMGYKSVPKKKSSEVILKQIKEFCIRITNKELKLPPKIYKPVGLEKTAEQTQLLTQLNDYFALEFKKVKLETNYIFTLINKSLQICSGFIKDGDGNVEVVHTEKDQFLVDILEDINAKQHKVLIWCNFLFVIEKLNKLLTKLGYNVRTLTGATEDANAVVSAFQYDKSVNILLAIQKKASDSITLTNCNYVVYYCNGWSADERNNSEARTYRKGSEKHAHVLYIDLFVKDTVDEKVYQCLKQKKSLIETLKTEFGSI